MRDVRFVIVHSPGPKWKPDTPIIDQEGVQAHMEHYRALLDRGMLALGGPFLDRDGGGMMILEPGLDEEAVTALAAADPAVASGLLQAKVRPWLVGLKRELPR